MKNKIANEFREQLEIIMNGFFQSIKIYNDWAQISQILKLICKKYPLEAITIFQNLMDKEKKLGDWRLGSLINSIKFLMLLLSGENLENNVLENNCSLMFKLLNFIDSHSSFKNKIRSTFLSKFEFFFQSVTFLPFFF